MLAWDVKNGPSKEARRLSLYVAQRRSSRSFSQRSFSLVMLSTTGMYVPGNVENILLIEMSDCLLMSEPAGDREVFAGGFDKVCGGK